jgi:molybdenum cofactor guanylyltransferase
MAVSTGTPQMQHQNITGLILAGGRARRMGGADKGLIHVGDKPMIEYVVERLDPQVKHLVINANRNQSAYRRWTDNVVEDNIGVYDGPLAGMASGLQIATTEFVLTVPCDSPLLASDLADRMYKQLTKRQADVAVASDGARIQPVFTLLRREVAPSIISFLQQGERKIDKWFCHHAVTTVDFSDKPETFMNINTAKDKEQLASALHLNRLEQAT